MRVRWITVHVLVEKGFDSNLDDALDNSPGLHGSRFGTTGPWLELPDDEESDDYWEAYDKVFDEPIIAKEE